MTAHCPESFDREMGCTEGELLRWLPGAARGLPIEPGVAQARVAIEDGALVIAWQVLPARRIALLSMPRLAVSFRFEGVAEPQRRGFMRHFDLYTQRGGG